MPNDVTIRVKTKGTKEAKKAFKGMDSAASSLKKAAIGVGVALGARQLGRQMGQAVDRAEQMNSAYAATQQILKQTGGVVNLTALELKNMNREVSLLTGIDKALVTESTNVLLTFKNIREEVGAGNDIFTRAQTVMLDFATLMGTDAKTGAIQLGKALNDPITGLTALARVGVTFTDQQKEQIRTMQESGDILGAQKVILRELESQVGGLAEVTADSTDKIANAWKEVQEQIGNELLPLIEQLTPAIVNIAAGTGPAIERIGLGFQTVKRHLDAYIGAVDFALGPSVNFGDIHSDIDETLRNVTKRMVDYREQLRDGADEGRLFAGLMLDMGDDARFFGSSLQLAIEATNISTDGLREAIQILLINADAYGLNATQVDNLRRELHKITFDDFINGAVDAGVAAGGAAEETDDFAESVDNVRLSLRELTDPVFRAEKAIDAYREVLKEARKDGELTQQEIEDVTEAWVDQQEAVDALTPENIESFSDAAQQALGLTAEAADHAADQLAAAGRGALPDLERLAAKAGELFDKDLIIKVRTTAPSSATMDRLMRDAVARARRNGLFQWK